jgi:hypothetical protein
VKQAKAKSEQDHDPEENVKEDNREEDKREPGTDIEMNTSGDDEAEEQPEDQEHEVRDTVYLEG